MPPDCKSDASNVTDSANGRALQQIESYRKALAFDALLMRYQRSDCRIARDRAMAD
jgi:hypothetical protein